LAADCFERVQVRQPEGLLISESERQWDKAQQKPLAEHSPLLLAELLAVSLVVCSVGHSAQHLDLLLDRRWQARRMIVSRQKVPMVRGLDNLLFPLRTNLGFGAAESLSPLS
jgi:hypothetical protein